MGSADAVGKGPCQMPAERFGIAGEVGEIIERERARIAGSRRSGPTAENILRDLGTVASRIG